MTIYRADNYKERSEHLRNLSETELDDLFWKLAGEIVAPLLELAKTHTSPSIERSVLLRMGLDSFQADAVVSKARESGLLGKGVGNLILRYARDFSLRIEDAVFQLSTGIGWEHLVKVFKRGESDAADK